ncbi:hypothetical protein RJ641_033767 [Dillenia turbinata]|uniref:UBA domain-containing protein n=1 Tax=Dillenia turbinata TaxID=194707 RepID=A0AAN8ZGD2_9MAGN
MDYDYRNRAGSAYDSQIPMYRTSATSAPPSSSSYSSIYPRVGQHGVSPALRTSPSYHHTSHPSSSSSSGLGIRVTIKPEYRITPPPPLSPHIGDIPRSTFQFDFDFERKILAEAEKEAQNWSKLSLENLPPKPSVPASSSGLMADPVVSKYIASGLSREAVPLAVANYGDNPIKVTEFANGYHLLREMGFSSNNVAEALMMSDNDTDKALAHLLNSSSK